MPETAHVDVLVVGSGPVGAVYARTAVEAGHRVLMVDAGPQQSTRLGAHLKNAYQYQRNIDLFTPVVRGQLIPVSTPANANPEMQLDPCCYQVDLNRYRGLTTNNQNPNQRPETNIPASAVSYCVGGMTTHWTCATPRHHPVLERSPLLPDAEWDDLYTEAEQIFGTREDVYDGSLRHELVRESLLAEYRELAPPYAPRSLPLAVRRRTDNPALVHWSGTDDVFGPLADGVCPDLFDLRAEHLCTRLFLSADGTRVTHAEIRDLTKWRTFRVEARRFVVACGAVLTPQLLYASGIRPPALGRYLTEQPEAFCQVVLSHDLVEAALGRPEYAERIARHQRERPQDPLPIPVDEPDPQLWIPVSTGRPWHCQIHRDAYHYGQVAPNVDPRLVVDLRWFGMAESRWENRIAFSDDNFDLFGLPQPTFEFTLSAEDRKTQHAMMGDMLRAACALGGFLPGSEPRFVTPGVPLHIAGTTRMGKDPATSVVDVNSQVWGITNLQLGGNGLIPRGTASNPTLTSVATALKGARHLLKEGM
ncbi:pyranose oxidase [Streptomyces sp. NPDC007205]|uniref:pyranose oxidase n=1 Tax=Streptomyces sp. NPDC007205 TaxID=3154316 RepID=UPI0033FD5204